MPQHPFDGDAVRREVKSASIFFAVEWHKRECPGAHEDQRFLWAARHWRKFTDMALDFMALREAMEEKEGLPSDHPPTD